MKLLIIDNFDSFTYNLQHYAAQFCEQVVVKRNDEISIEEIDEFDGFIISPGPGLPIDSGISYKALEVYGDSKKILGICLGHQAIAEFYGAELSNLGMPLHGIAVETEVLASEDMLFRGLPQKIQTGRYHSWVVNPNSIKNTPLQITATDYYNQVQGLKHPILNIRGLQFHPESVLTEYGIRIIENWIKYC